MAVRLRGKRRVLVNSSDINFDTSALYAWYDVTNTSSVTTVSGNISQLNDISNNGRHLTQGTAGSRPSYNATGGGNNKPYANFTGNKVLSNLTLSSISNITVYVAYKPKSWTDFGNLMYYNNTYDGIIMRTYDSQNGLGFANNASYGISFHNMARLQWQVVSVNFSGSGTQYRLNDEPLITDTGGAVINSLNKIVIGGSSIDMDFSEMLIFSAKPSAADDVQIRQYLYNKYTPTVNKYIIYFGDSITKGEAATNYNRLSWAALTAIDKGYNFYNYGVSGAIVAPWATYGMTGNGFSLSDQYTKAQQKNYTGNLVVTAYGTNDASGSSTSDALWKSQYKSLLQTIIGYGYSAGQIVVATPPYQSARPTMPSFKSNISAIASELGAIYGNIYDYTQANGGDTLLSDGIHPTNTGHNTIATYLKTLIPTA